MWFYWQCAKKSYQQENFCYLNDNYGKADFQLSRECVWIVNLSINHINFISNMSSSFILILNIKKDYSNKWLISNIPWCALSFELLMIIIVKDERLLIIRKCYQFIDRWPFVSNCIPFNLFIFFIRIQRRSIFYKNYSC